MWRKKTNWPVLSKPSCRIWMPHIILARWLTRNDHDAEDMVQEAYLRAFKFFQRLSTVRMAAPGCSPLSATPVIPGFTKTVRMK